jgi:hypothetical protein
MNKIWMGDIVMVTRPQQVLSMQFAGMIGEVAAVQYNRDSQMLSAVMLEICGHQFYPQELVRISLNRTNLEAYDLSLSIDDLHKHKVSEDNARKIKLKREFDKNHKSLKWRKDNE